MKIIDCFPFFNELDLLEVRLNALAPYVDHFILCEMPITHSSKPKPLYFQENKERFKDFNIVHLVAPVYQGKAWNTEHYQREYIMNALDDDNDIILISDADEIPNLEEYHVGDEGSFRQRMYYYYFNVFMGESNWRGTIAIRKKNITTLNKVRNRRNKFPVVVENGGWHFSTLGTSDQIKYKIESFAHIELDTKEFKDQIEHRRNSLTDPYVNGASNWRKHPMKLSVEEPSGPKWLLENKHKFDHLWYKTYANDSC